ncbi:MAG: GntR family transcriptional regulator [Aeoliella sp.]
MIKNILTLKQHAYQLILTRLESGKLAPGSRLSDDALSKELGVSRSPVREAILQLTGEGLIEQRPRQGAFVSVPDRQELAELFEARQPLESCAARLAAERRSNSDLKKLLGLQDRMADVLSRCGENGHSIVDTELTEEFLALDFRAHSLILEMADNRKIAQMARVCRVLSRSFSLSALEHESEVIRRSVDQHEAFVKAIRDGDAQRASVEMAAHIAYAGDRVTAAYDHLSGSGRVVSD